MKKTLILLVEIPSISAIILVGVPFSFSLIIHFIVFSSSFTQGFVGVGNNFGKRQLFLTVAIHGYQEFSVKLVLGGRVLSVGEFVAVRGLSTDLPVLYEVLETDSHGFRYRVRKYRDKVV